MDPVGTLYMKRKQNSSDADGRSSVTWRFPLGLSEQLLLCDQVDVAAAAAAAAAAATTGGSRDSFPPSSVQMVTL